MNLLEKLEASFLKPNLPEIKIGQTLKVSLNIVEGDKVRIQVYEGIVIGKRGRGHRETITVRKVSYGVGVERVFPLHSPLIQKVAVVREGEVKRAKLYYLRERSGRAGRIADKKKEVKKGAVSSPLDSPFLSPLVPTPVTEESPPVLISEPALPVSVGSS